MKTVELDNFLAKAFEHVDCPETHKKAIERIYQAYPFDCLPKGICDPVYMLNVFCQELGIGDGRSNFFNYEVTS